MFQGKKGWIIAIVVGGVIGLMRLGHSGDASTSGAGETINQERQLSAIEKQYAVMGVGFTPMKAPCSLSRSGHEDVDECEGSNDISYGFSFDHKNLTMIKRTEDLPSNVSFDDLIRQISAKYGRPSTVTRGTGVCQAIWGDDSGTRGIGYWVSAKDEPCHYSDTGLKVTYKLLDSTEYAKTSRLVDQHAAQNSATAVSNHRF